MGPLLSSYGGTIRERKGNIQILTKAGYLDMIAEVKVTKSKQSSKSPEKYQRLRRYDFISAGDVEKLMVSMNENDSSMRYYAFVEETFEMIHGAHDSLKERNCM